MSKITAKPEAEIEQELAYIVADAARKIFPIVGIGASAGGLSADAISVQDFRGRILAWNRRAAEAYGYNEEEALQLNSQALIAERSLAEIKNMLQQLQQGKKLNLCESWRRRKDGREFLVLLATSLLYDEAVQPVSIAFTEHELP